MYDEIKNGIEKCIHCEMCMEEGICPSYTVTKEYQLSPIGRLDALRSLLENRKKEDIERSLLTCNFCGRCTQVCPEEIPIGELVVLGRNILYEKGSLPTPKQERIIASILNKGNAVPKGERLIYKDPSYKEIIKRESDTVLFLGCICSFFQENTIKASIGILEQLEISFRLLEDEGCCGIFLYDGGYFDKAESFFKRNLDRFKKLGIRKIIVLCPSCYKCFSVYYPRLIKGFDLEIVHLVEIIAKELEKGKTLTPAVSDNKIILHEPCKMTRFMGILEEPRQILRRLKIEFDEFQENRLMSMCCGAGGGVRAYDMEIALKIGAYVLRKAEGRDIVTTCPFCVMNFNASSKKYGIKSKAFHLAEVIKGE